MWLCEDKLKGKIAHFRLPSASQKCARLSSLITPELRALLFSISVWHLYPRESGGGGELPHKKGRDARRLA